MAKADGTGFTAFRNCGEMFRREVDLFADEKGRFRFARGRVEEAAAKVRGVEGGVEAAEAPKAAVMPFGKRLSLPLSDFLELVPGMSKALSAQSSTSTRHAVKTKDLIHLSAAVHHALGRDRLLGFTMDLAFANGCAVSVSGQSVPRFVASSGATGSPTSRKTSLWDQMVFSWDEAPEAERVAGLLGRTVLDATEDNL